MERNDRHHSLSGDKVVTDREVFFSVSELHGVHRITVIGWLWDRTYRRLTESISFSVLSCILAVL